jgi:hypothetical protein
MPRPGCFVTALAQQPGDICLSHMASGGSLPAQELRGNDMSNKSSSVIRETRRDWITGHREIYTSVAILKLRRRWSRWPEGAGANSHGLDVSRMAPMFAAISSILQLGRYTP